MSYESVEKEFIIQKRLGTHVKVHISNLISPSEKRSIRPLDNKHVLNLVKVFDNKYSGYTTLVGLVLENNNTDYSSAGDNKIEVLGGNHTRVALQTLIKQKGVDICDYEFVYMDLYHDLTDQQAWFVGLQHNEIHESSRPMNFADKCTLLRKLFIASKNKHGQLKSKEIATKWRSEVAATTGKSKDELKSTMKIHLHLASMDDELWNTLHEVFIALTRVEENITQYMFMPFTKIKVKERKMSLLMDVAERRKTVSDFRKCCQREVTLQTDEVLRCADNVNGLDKDRSRENVTCGIDTEKGKKLDTELPRNNDTQDTHERERESLVKSLKHEKDHRIILQQKYDDIKRDGAKKDKKIAFLEANEKQLRQINDEEIVYLKNAVGKYKSSNIDLKVTLENMSSKYYIEKTKCKLAEDAAARARACPTSNETTDKIKSIKKVDIKRKHPLNEEKMESDQKNKRVRTSEGNTGTKDQPVNVKCDIAKTVSEENVKRASNSSKSETKEQAFNTKGANTEAISLGSQTKENIEKEKENSKDKVNIGIVEYTNGKVYYGILNKDNITYCLKPTGKIKDKTYYPSPSKLAFTINLKDNQKFNKSYLICEMCGEVQSGIIKIDQLSMSIDEQILKLKNYIDRKL